MHPFGTVIRVLVCFDMLKLLVSAPKNFRDFGIDLGLGVGIDLSA